MFQSLLHMSFNFYLFEIKSSFNESLVSGSDVKNMRSEEWLKEF